MTTEALAEDENNLYKIVLNLYGIERTKKTIEKLENIFVAYRQIHKQYSELADKDDEALKRGLFIQWYAITEPADLTGILNLDEQAQIKIINILENKIQSESIDSELNWMLNYYATWDFAFEQFGKFEGLKNFIQSRNDKYFPSKIDRISMNNRGQMGQYWNSLTTFKNEENASH